MATTAISPKVTIKKILVATDLSDASERALDYAVSFAHRYASSLDIVHVMAQEADSWDAQSVDRLPEDRRRSLKSKLQKLVNGAGRSGVSANGVLAEGCIGKSVHDLVLQREVDMVAVGTHGKDEVERLALGSVAESIFREVPCPVLTVGPMVSRRPELEIRFRHILYATDFTPESAQAAPLALSLAEEYRAGITLVHVMPADTMSTTEIERYAEYYGEELRNVLPPGVDLWCRPNFLMDCGKPGSVIVEFAKHHEADLIILGVKRATAVAERTVSGTAYNVVSKSECPVITVRGQ